MAISSCTRLLTGLAIIPLSLMTACMAPLREARPVLGAGEIASMQIRVEYVAFPLLLASVAWCPFDQEPAYGFLLADRQALEVPGSDTRGGRAMVLSVHPRSPAASADLRVGDQVLEVNTQSVSETAAKEVMALVHRLTGARIQPLQLDILRSDGRHRLHLGAVQACQFSLRVIEADQINALSNGRQIWVTTGLMRFMRSDDELAWVLAHEIAHNVLGHVQESKLQAMLNALLGATVSEPASPSAPGRSLEAQADYVGSYIMARAGYDLQIVRRVWQRLREIEVQRAPSVQPLGRSHPTTDERLAAFEATFTEIEGMRARGEVLDPIIGPR